MQIPKINLTIVAWVVIAVMLTLQLKSCFDRTPPNEKVIRLDEQIKAIEQQRVSDSMIAAGKLREKDIEIAYLRQQDTVYVNKLVTNDKKIKASNDRVDGLTNSELERSITAKYDY